MYTYNETHLTQNGQPWLPMMGEIHYSRVPQTEWEESLYKMKAGGVELVSSYAIWLHHEEVEGEYDFTGCRDLRRFVETVQRCGLRLILRLGPWVHGEVRNGGFPDWLLQKPFAPRTNDPEYLACVTVYYNKLFEQVIGLLLKDGGPIIGVQIENEYGHAGGLAGEEGEQHMRNLTKIAQNTGFMVPLYTATGWGGAVTGGLLPVMGGYCDAPWDASLNELEPSGNFLFTPERNDHNIGSDYGLGHGITFDTSKFPYLTAELGGGLQVTEHRRTVATADDIAAVTNTKLGSGANLLGYYMYHGGVNPVGKRTTLEENRATGYPSNLPVYNYDFRAPLGAYGQITPTWRVLKLYAMFLADFGQELCGMHTEFPADNPANPSDLEHLRHSFRHNGKWGYVFFNRYVRHRTLQPCFGAVMRSEELHLALPPVTIQSGAYGFYPVNMPVHGGVIRFAEATPLCKINQTTVLYGDENGLLDADPGADVLVISRADALCAAKIKLQQEHLLICDSPVLPDADGWYVLAESDTVMLKAYPPLSKTPTGFVRGENSGAFAVYTCVGQLPQNKAACTVTQQTPDTWTLHFDGLHSAAHDYLATVRYRGDKALVSVKGQPVYDDFWADGTFAIGLARHGFARDYTVQVTPLHKGAQRYLEQWPKLENGVACVVDEVKVKQLVRMPLGQ